MEFEVGGLARGVVGAAQVPATGLGVMLVNGGAGSDTRCSSTNGVGYALQQHELLVLMRDEVFFAGLEAAAGGAEGDKRLSRLRLDRGMRA